VTKLVHWVSASAATLALGLFAITAGAQQPAPTAKAPAAKAPAAKAPAPKAPQKKAVSPCQDLDEAACKANTECSWVAATKTKTGKEVKAYCRVKAKTAAKAPPKAAEPKKK
jgi:hypothetical protein